MTIYIPFKIPYQIEYDLKSIKHEFLFVSEITKQTIYPIFRNRIFTLNLKGKSKEKWRKNEKK